MGIFSGHHFPREIILWAVRWYCRYGVSYRDLEEMMTERGVPVDHTTTYRWVQKYAPELDKQTRRYRQVPDWQASSWRVDETYIQVGGEVVLPLSGYYRWWADLGLLPLSEAERGRSEAFPGQGPQIQCVSRVSQSDQHR